MSAHEFTMVVEGVDLDAQDGEIATLDERFDGLTWGESDGQVGVTAEVAGETLVSAVMEAIAAVESIPTARVVRVGPDQYVSQAEIARRIGVSRQYVSLLASGARGPGDFSQPDRRERPISDLAMACRGRLACAVGALGSRAQP